MLLPRSMSSVSEQLFPEDFLAGLVSLPPQMKCDLINTFRPNLRLIPPRYIEAHYVDLLKLIRKNLDDLKGSGYRFAMQNLDGLLVVVKTMNAHRTSTKEDLVREISNNYHDYGDDGVIRSIELQLTSGSDFTSLPRRNGCRLGQGTHEIPALSGTITNGSRRLLQRHSSRNQVGPLLENIL